MPLHSQFDSGTPLLDARDLSLEARALFASSVGERVEDGVEGEFFRRLLVFVDRYEHEGVAVLENLFRDEQTDKAVVAEALRWLGDMEHASTREARRRLLESTLDSESPVVRDGAELGISYLDDSQSAPALERALATEGHRFLRESIREVSPGRSIGIG